MISADSAAFNTLLAHRVAADQLIVNGYDVLAIDEGLINLLKDKNILKYRDVDAIIERAKIPHPLRIKVQAKPEGPKP